MSQKSRLRRVAFPRHFNPNDPAHCDACFKEGEARIVGGVVKALQDRGVLSKRRDPLRMARAALGRSETR